MTFQTERDLFILAVVDGMTITTERKTAAYDLAKRLLRHAQTLHRHTVAQCNGDWPADHGGEWETVSCSRCESRWHPSVLRGGKDKRPLPGFVSRTSPKLCPDCHTQDAVSKLLLGTPFKPIFGGDPRGAVLKLAPVNATREAIDSGTCRLLAVPVRER